MDIFSVITLLGGLAFFLYGMNVMSSGLEKLCLLYTSPSPRD